VTDFSEQAIYYPLLLRNDVAEVVERGFLMLETDFEFDNGLGHLVLPRVIKGSEGFEGSEGSEDFEDFEG